MKVTHNGKMILILEKLYMSQLKLIVVEENLKLSAQTS